MSITVSKPVNLIQLQGEMQAASVPINQGLALHDDTLYDVVDGVQADFSNEAAAQAALDAHVALRDKTDEEYAAEFQDSSTPPARKQEIRDITAGLMPREQVPM